IELSAIEHNIQLPSHHLESIHQLLQHSLYSKVNDPAIALQFRYFLQDQSLIILTQHQQQPFFDLDIILSHLEQEIRRIPLKSIISIHVKFQIFDQNQPYFSYSILLQPTTHSPDLDVLR
ncbi:hypothetical protein, partial [Neosynechococcus sphagnicola]